MIFTHFALKSLCWGADNRADPLIHASLIEFLRPGTGAHTRHVFHIPSFQGWMHFSWRRTRSGEEPVRQHKHR